MVGGARPFLVGGVIRLVDAVNERNLSLFQSDKHNEMCSTSQKDSALKIGTSTKTQAFSLYL